MILRSENMSIFSYLNVPSAFLPLSEGYKPSPSWPKLDDGIPWINLYQVDNAFGFPITYLLDPTFELKTATPLSAVWLLGKYPGLKQTLEWCMVFRTQDQKVLT